MKQLIDPFELVAQALNTKKETLNIDSKMHDHPNWDSIENVEVANAIEINYGIVIDYTNVNDYSSMRAIVELYEKLKKE